MLSFDDSTPITDIQDILKEANSYISFVADDCKELYEGYKYRLFKTNEGYLVISGEELDTDPEGGS